jgi:TPR repeat protein
LKGCEGGWMSACIQIAEFYAWGIGVEKDVERAIIIYENACTSGKGRQLACRHLERLRAL